MVATIPALLFAAAGEAMLLTILIPQYLPANPFFRCLIRTTLFNFFCFSVYKVLIWPFLLTPLRHLPNPGGEQILLGNGRAMFQKPPGTDFLRWLSAVPNDGLIYFRGFLHQDRLLVTSPKVLGELLVTKSYDFEKPKPVRDFLRRVLGDGLIIVEGDVHKFQRKHIMPVFQFRHIKELYPMMLRKAQQMTDLIRNQVSEDIAIAEKQGGVAEMEINHWANKVTMDIIGVAGLGRDFNALRNSDDELIQNYEEMLEPSKEKSVFFLTQTLGPKRLAMMLPWDVPKRFRVITGNLDRITKDLVRAKKDAVKKGGEEHLDILSVLIKSNNFSDQELCDQMLTFLAAGHETTSSAFTWCTYLLSTHPEIQTRLRDEIRENLPAEIGPEVELASILESMPVLNAVCNETLRLYPTVPMTVRQAIRPTTLNNQFIPAQTQIILSPWAINRSPELWGSNADKFVPDRWINEDGKPNNSGGAPSNYAILTFLHGPRSCIGANFAKAELRCIVAMFVKNFLMELANPDAEVVPAGVITTKPRDGMHLRLTPIKS
ncbi:hypothetical protein ANO11243_005060 [Dothideomycetidae sp. 11243]|nr:hypothetical protein ANO11243_005060 [fungal sp. No.11243]